ncbi:hypothetical protein [Streptomyces sp. NPDC058657]|uniref:hypothetical protein n=1 Tax=unclassified Streptomyces TaxID=2593676 RepID=UPI00365643FC
MRIEITCYQPEKSGFARSVRADQRGGISLSDSEGDVTQQRASVRQEVLNMTDIDVTHGLNMPYAGVVEYRAGRHAATGEDQNRNRGEGGGILIPSPPNGAAEKPEAARFPGEGNTE